MPLLSLLCSDFVVPWLDPPVDRSVLQARLSPTPLEQWSRLKRFPPKLRFLLGSPVLFNKHSSILPGFLEPPEATQLHGSRGILVAAPCCIRAQHHDTGGAFPSPNLT